MRKREERERGCVFPHWRSTQSARSAGAASERSGCQTQAASETRRDETREERSSVSPLFTLDDTALWTRRFCALRKREAVAAAHETLAKPSGFVTGSRSFSELNVSAIRKAFIYVLVS